MVLRN